MSNETSTASVFQHSLIQMMTNAHSQQTLMFSKIMERIESGENISHGKGEDIAAGQSNNIVPLTSLKRKSDNRDGSMPSTSKQSKTDADPVVVAKENVSDSDDGFDTLEQEIPDRQEGPSENVDDLMKDWVTFHDDNDITSPKVNKELAKSINHSLCKELKEDKLKPLMEKYNRPENCNNLNNPKVNEEIWEDAFPCMRRNDCAMRKVISYLTTGMIPLIQVIDSCVTAAKNGDKVDIKSTISSGNDALRLLAAAYVKMISIRKQSFRPVLKGKYNKLVDKSEVTDDLSKQITAIADAAKISGKLKGFDNESKNGKPPESGKLHKLLKNVTRRTFRNKKLKAEKFTTKRRTTSD